jgi:predicted DCC family thiol-disulfide oxidoreductase YuxK
VARAREPLLVLYDGDCGFCAWALAWLLRWDRAQRLRPVAIGSEEGARLLAGMPPERRLASWHACDAHGLVRSGGAALAHVLWRVPGGGPLADLAQRFPRATEAGYAWVAEHRSCLGKLVSAAGERRARALIAARML